MKSLLLFLKQWILVIAAIIGMLFHSHIAKVAFLSPYLLVIMLIFTFIGMAPKEMRFRPLHGVLFLCQMAGCFLVYRILLPWNELAACSACLCMLTPAAAAASTVTSMMGGSVGVAAAYILLDNLALTVAAPFIIPLIAPGHTDMPILLSMWQVFAKVAPVMLLPLAVAWSMRAWTPKLAEKVQQKRIVAYYLWAFVMMTVVATAFEQVDKFGEDSTYMIVTLAGTGFVLCILEFIAGKGIGSLFGQRIAAGQSLGQKNILISMWLCMHYLPLPIVICLASHSITQNTINAVQIALYERKLKRTDFPLKVGAQKQAAQDTGGTDIQP